MNFGIKIPGIQDPGNWPPEKKAIFPIKGPINRKRDVTRDLDTQKRKANRVSLRATDTRPGVRVGVSPQYFTSSKGLSNSLLRCNQELQIIKAGSSLPITVPSTSPNVKNIGLKIKYNRI